MKKEKKNSNKKNIPGNTREKKYGVLIFGALIVIISLIFAVITYNSSYQESVTIKEELTAMKTLIKAIEEGKAPGNLENLTLEADALSAQKLALERPYSYSLATLFFGILLLVKGIFNAVIGIAPSEKADVRKLTQAGLLAALCYIGFAFFKFDIPVGAEKTAFHLGNVFCVLAALLLGGYWGGLAGAIGMTFADLTTSYVTSAPKTFLLKLCIGLIVGFVAHKVFKISQSHPQKYLTRSTIIACACGMGFNIIADPLVGYFYKTYLLGVPQDLAATLAKVNLLTTSVNALVAVAVATIFYMAIRPALKKSGLFVQVTPEEVK